MLTRFRQQTSLSLFVYAAILVAFFLRVYRLADQNIWWDEGWSIWLARQDFSAIALRTAMDEHPPLHYWMLKVWGGLAGWDVYTGRFLSLAFGVLTVALVYRLGRGIGGAWVGVLAAFILASSRFHIWWSQDVKNYTPSIFFAFAAVWFALRLLERARKGEGGLAHGIAYAFFAFLATFTHYLAALVLIALNLYALLLFAAHAWRPVASAPRSSRRLLAWVAANVLAAALFAPWFYLYLQNAQTWVAAPTFDFGSFLKLVATVLPLGVTTDVDSYLLPVIAFTLLALLPVLVGQSSFVRPSAKSPRSAIRPPLLFALIVLFPPLLVYLLSLTPAAFFAPKIQARYLVVLAPAYAMLIALALLTVSRIARPLAYVAFVFVIAASAFVLRDYYAERRPRDEYATLANTVNAFARQGDVVLLDTDQEWPTFLYYLRPRLDWLGAPNGAAMNTSDADLIVRRALNRGSAVWLVEIPDARATDPDKILETRLARDLPKRYERAFGDKRLALYAPDERDLVQVLGANLQIQNPLPFVPFGDASDPNGYQAQLIGFDLPIREARAGDVIHVTTYWNGAAARGELQLIDAAKRVALSTPLELPSGKDVRVVSDLRMPADARGEYTLSVRIANESFALSHLKVEPRAAERVGEIARRVDYRLGDAIRLVGYDLPQSRFRAGDQLSITLYWQADRAVEKSYTVFVHVRGEQFNPSRNNPLWGQIDRLPRDGAYPTTAWLPAQIVGDPYRVSISADAPAGKYWVEVGLYAAVSGDRLKLRDGSSSIVLAEIQVVR